VHEEDVVALGGGELVEVELAADDPDGSGVAVGPDEGQAVQRRLVGVDAAPGARWFGG
jgi:hypothetical protein